MIWGMQFGPGGKSIAAAGLGILFLSNAQAAETFDYSAWIDSHAHISVADATVVFGDDQQFSATLCDTASAMVCVFAGPLTFSFPRKWDDASSRAWSFRDVDFQIVGKKRTMALFGCQVRDIWLVSARPRTAKPMQAISHFDAYLFSVDRGLVAFGTLPSIDKSSRLTHLAYWSARGVGFGSLTDRSPSCD